MTTVNNVKVEDASETTVGVYATTTSIQSSEYLSLRLL